MSFYLLCAFYHQPLHGITTPGNLRSASMALQGDKPVAAAEEEDDYMSMTFTDPTPKKPSTSLERARQQRLEAESRSKPRSKADLEREAAFKREVGLNSALNNESKGAKMMAKMGYKTGEALGRSDSASAADPGAPSASAHSPPASASASASMPQPTASAHTDSRLHEPLRPTQRDHRVGLGADTAVKRRAEEAISAQLAASRAKAAKLSSGLDRYRSTVGAEREEKRLEGCVWAAMKIAESLDLQLQGQVCAGDGIEDDDGRLDVDAKDLTAAEIRSVNVLYRDLVIRRRERALDAKRRRELSSFANLPSLRDAEEDGHDRLALQPASGIDDEEDLTETVQDAEGDEDEDAEMVAFRESPVRERLDRLVGHLRGQHRYCFWCKYQYPDTEMDGCPGVSEDEHG